MKYGFGADVGGTTVKLGLFDETGVLLERRELPTRTENGGEAILPDIAAAIGEILEEKGIGKADVTGVGIGVPGPVSDDGLVNRCVNLNWGVFNLHEALGRLTGLRVKAGNDANCAALGEFWKGGGMGCRSAIFITLGTGIGGGVIVDGRLLGGAHGVGLVGGHYNKVDPFAHKTVDLGHLAAAVVGGMAEVELHVGADSGHGAHLAVHLAAPIVVAALRHADAVAGLGLAAARQHRTGAEGNQG